MIKVEACPFCGLYGKAKSRYSDNSMSLFWFVQCIGCKAKTGNYDTKEQAVRAWNGRAQPVVDPPNFGRLPDNIKAYKRPIIGE